MPTTPSIPIPSAEALLGDLPATDLPVALLPVRLETRFVEGEGTWHLCLRVFPDDLHVDAHEPELTADEERWGHHFWEEVWRTRGDAEATLALREDLVARFGPGRSDWIVQATTPGNADALAPVRTTSGDVLPESPVFPAVERRGASWTRAPRVRALPDRWMVFGYRGQARVLVAAGEPIARDLAGGPDPSAPPPVVEDNELSLDPGVRWLVDFDEAVRAGMGLRIPLASEAEARQGYDRLVVVGVQGADRRGEGNAELETLFIAQRFSDGLAFVPQGTPTNHTGAGPAGGNDAAELPGIPVRRSGIRGEPSNVLSDPPLRGPAERSEPNHRVLARALGLGDESLRGLAHADDGEQSDARAMNIALWSATWGYFLGVVLQGVVSDAELAGLRRHFVDHVRARGPIPLLQVGRQPLGILPVTPLDGVSAPEGGASNGHMSSRAVEALRVLRERWRQAVPVVHRVQPYHTPASMANRVAEILGMDATFDHLLARMALDGVVHGLPERAGLDVPPDPSMVERKERAMSPLREIGVAGDAPGARMGLSEPMFALDGDLVGGGADVPGSTEGVPYIRALRNATVDTLVQLQAPGRGAPPLFFLLLRHSLLLAYAHAGYRIRVAEGDLPPDSFQDPALVDVHAAVGPDGTREPTPEATPTPLRFLDGSASFLGDAPLRDHVHRLGAAHHPEAADLDELREALDLLAALPAHRLDLLLRETLALGSHRLDAWITSLATSRLDELRRVQPSGVILGGYGWLEGLRMTGTRAPVVFPPAGEGGGTTPLLEAEGSAGYVLAPSLGQAATAAVLRSGYRAYGTGDAAAPFAIDLSADRVRVSMWILDGVRQGQPLTALLGYRFERGLRDAGLARYVRPFRLLAPFGELYEAEARKAEREQERDRQISTHQTNRSAFQKAQDALSAQIASLTSQINAKTSQRTQFQNQVDTLTTEINNLTKTLIPARKATVDLWAGRLHQFRNDPPLSERKMEAQVQLNAATTALQSAQTSLSSKTSSRTTRQNQIATLTTEITNLTNQRHTQTIQRNAKASQQDRKDRDHATAIAGLNAQITSIQSEIDTLERAHRERYALSLGALPPSEAREAMTAIEAQHVVDGLTLLRKWQADEVVFGTGDLPPVQSSDARALAVRLDELAALVDAVGDLLLAEGVHQLVGGNETRAGATLDTLAAGEAPPPDPTFVRTPRSGTAVTHRVAVLLSPGAEPTPEWPTDSFQRHAGAEPTLNAWLAQLLPHPARVSIRYTYRDPHTGQETPGRATLDRFMVSPMDVVRLGPRGGNEGGSALETLIRYRLLVQRPAGVPEDASLSIHLEDPEGSAGASDAVSFGAFLEAGRAARSLVTGVRPLDARDLDSPGTGGSGVDVAELGARAEALASSFRLYRDHLLRQVEALSAAPDLNALRVAMLRFAWLGVEAAVPLRLGSGPEDRAALEEQATSLLAEVERRAAALDLDEFPGITPDEGVARQTARIRAVLGSDFPVLPRFRVADPSALTAPFAEGSRLQDGDPLAAVDWFRQVALVRERSDLLATSLAYAEALDAGPGFVFAVGQHPRGEGDRWIALPFQGDAPEHPPEISLVVHAPQGIDGARPAAGLLVDEWVEILPARRETAGMVFHHDAPASHPPHAMILGLAPTRAPRWTLVGLESVVLETMDLMAMRAVDPAALALDPSPEHGHLLPAAYLAFNAAGDTVSTDLSVAAGVVG